MLREMVYRNEGLQVFLHCVAVCACNFYDLAYRYFPMLFNEFQNLHREFRQRVDDNFLAFYLFFKSLLLLLKRTQKIYDPWFPLRRITADCTLRFAQCHIVSFFRLLNHAFERTIGNISIAAAQK